MKQNCSSSKAATCFTHPQTSFYAVTKCVSLKYTKAAHGYCEEDFHGKIMSRWLNVCVSVHAINIHYQRTCFRRATFAMFLYLPCIFCTAVYLKSINFYAHCMASSNAVYIINTVTFMIKCGAFNFKRYDKRHFRHDEVATLGWGVV